MLRILFFFFSFQLVSTASANVITSDLTPVIVSGTRSYVSDVSVPSLITVISQAQIQSSGAQNLVDVLRGLGGLQISDLFGDGTDVSIGIRGFSSTAQQNTLIMIDGRRLNNADNGLPDLNTVALRNIERVEIIKGSAGVLYGDKAVGGVINIITRSPEILNIQTEVSYGSYQRRTLYARVENRHDNGIAYRLSAERRLSDNYRNSNDFQLTNLSGKLNYDYSGGKLFIEYQDLNEDIETPGSLFRDLISNNRRQALNSGDFINTDTSSGRIGIRQRLFNGIEGQVEYTNRLNKTEGQLSSGGTLSPINLKRHHLELTPRLTGDFSLPTGRAFITIGADLFKTDYNLRSNFGLTDNTQSQYSVYGQGVFSLSDSLDLTVGGRFGRVENDILVDTLAFGRSLPAGTEIDDNAEAFQAGLSYALNQEWRLFGKFDRNYRFATADEYSAVADNNFFANLFAFGTIVPLPETQTGRSYEFGAEWMIQGAGVKTLFYQLDLDKEIVFNPVLFLNTNIGDSRRRGAIIEGHFSLTDNWRLMADYSFIDAEITSGIFDGTDLTFLAKHTGRIATEYRFNHYFNGYLEFTGTTDRVFAGDFANVFPALPGYVLSNLNLSYRRDTFSVAFRINNLLDKEYSDSGSIGFDFRQPFPSPQAETFFPAPERNFMLTVSYDY
jgi:iron complex outermembrane recepter protein